jgi:hypothetical protein
LCPEQKPSATPNDNDDDDDEEEAVIVAKNVAASINLLM